MKQKHWYFLLFALLGAFFFFPFLGRVHLFDWDEINFAEISREMIVLDEYFRIFVNYEPFWQKPPLFFWFQVISMKLWGINEYAARFPNAVCGVITLILLYDMGRKLYDHRFGLIWALVYLGSILPHLYFKSGIIDPFFNLFIFLGYYYFILFHWKKSGYNKPQLRFGKWAYLLWGGFILGLAVLTKGQVAYLLVSLSLFVYWVLQRFRFYVNVPEFLVYTIAASMVTLAWFGLETLNNGTWFVTEFNRYQMSLFSAPSAGHKGFPGYHVVVLLIGCFPASVFALRSFGKMHQEEVHHRDFRTWMMILFFVVLIVFTLAKSKIVHYSSMCYFPLTYLATLTLYQLWQKKISFPTWMRATLIFLGGIYIIAPIAGAYIGPNIEILLPLLQKDPFAVANIQAEVNWTGWEALPGVLMLVILIMSLRYFRRSETVPAIHTLFGGMACYIMLMLIFFIGRVERISQGAAIDFFKSMEGKDIYVHATGYRTYAPLFYFKKPPPPEFRADKKPNLDKRDSFNIHKTSDEEWLYYGDIDKDVYTLTKIHKTHKIKDIPGLEEIESKNGFVFYRRKKSALSQP